MAQQNAVAANPYGAPRASVDDAPEEYQPVRIFAVSGRIGRARYILYSIGVSMLIMLAAGVVSAVAGPVGIVAMGLAYVAVIVLSFMLSIQRSHDFNMTGWFSILWLIPVVNLLFWFIPGSDGPNRFGAKTPPNSTGVLIGVWIVPAIFIVGIIAAVSIPAYQHYMERAAQKQGR
jgi:uncharacterized membrane protein YhaH (DUF805 family)